MVTHAGPSSLHSGAAVGLFSEEELLTLERRYPAGLSSAEILHLFQSRGERFSEATFRKYVQLGLLSRSRRVGRKGKHKGSRGIYPVSILRQVVAIKRMMAEGLTIEQIQQSWLRFRPRIEALETDLGELLEEMRREVARPRFETERRTRLEDDLRTARRDARELLKQLRSLEHEVSWSPEEVGEDEELAEVGGFY